jgi:hypothetical protein
LKKHFYNYSAFEFAREIIEILSAEANMRMHQASRMVQVAPNIREFKAKNASLQV